MPNERVLSEKKAIVEALTERFQSASAGVFVDYRGITVADEVEYSVVKNTLTRFALDKVGLAGLDEVLHGTTSLATSVGDPIAPIRIVNDYAKKLGDRFNIKAAFMDGKILNAAEIEEIAALPSKDALYAKVLGTMLAPITSLAVCLGQILEQKGGSVESAEPATEEAPAAE